MKLVQESCEKFAELLASDSSVPGGGGAAAMVGALSAALCSMVGNFTVGKEKYSSVESDIKIILGRAETLRLKLLEFVDEDAKNFEPLAAAYKIPKENPEREKILIQATINACEVPLKIIEACTELVRLFEEICDKGNRLLISDVGCGAYLCLAALETAALNVFVNTASLKGNDEAERIESQMQETLGEYCPRAVKVALKATKILRRI